MGKWDKLKGRYEPKPFEDRSFAEKVDQARVNYAAMPLKDLLFHFNERDHEKDQLNEQISGLNVELAALDKLIQHHFDAMNVHSVQTDFGRTVYLHSEPTISTEDRAKFETHVDADPELSYLWSVNAQTLKTYIKGMLEREDFTDDQLPPGLKIWYDTKVRIKKT